MLLAWTWKVQILLETEVQQIFLAGENRPEQAKGQSQPHRTQEDGIPGLCGLGVQDKRGGLIDVRGQEDRKILLQRKTQRQRMTLE